MEWRKAASLLPTLLLAASLESTFGTSTIPSSTTAPSTTSVAATAVSSVPSSSSSSSAILATITNQSPASVTVSPVGVGGTTPDRTATPTQKPFTPYECYSGTCSGNDTCIKSVTTVCNVTTKDFGCYRITRNETFQFGCRNCTVDDNKEGDWCCMGKKDCEPGIKKSGGNESGATPLSSCVATTVFIATAIVTFIRLN